MKALLIAGLQQECSKWVDRHNEYLYELDQEAKRIAKRTGATPHKKIYVPEHWATHPNFDPFSVRINKKLKSFAHAISHKLRALEYKPQTALLRRVPKSDGTLRDVCVFQIPDAVVSRVVYKSLLYKNAHRFSAYSYAYREDVGVHEAVTNIFHDWQGRERIYVAEFDFSKFFDNIEHRFLWEAIKRAGFLMTQVERHVIEEFLTCRALDQSVYRSDDGRARTKGIPQGTSISLFLANAACWELDRGLERLGVGFARYADDTVVWSESYEKVVESYELLRRFSTVMGAPINYRKSEGIHLLSCAKKNEISSKEHVTFLGYEVEPHGIRIAEKQIANIKRNISKLIYCNLLKLPKGGAWNPDRLKEIDFDYLVALSQIRRYLYGGLTDSALLNYVRGITPRLNFRGLMSYYPVVNDEVQLRKLDGWLRYCLIRTLLKRQTLIAAMGGPAVLPGPLPDWIENLHKIRYVKIDDEKYDFRIPSFQLIYRVLSVALERGGSRLFAATSNAYY